MSANTDFHHTWVNPNCVMGWSYKGRLEKKKLPRKLGKSSAPLNPVG